MCLIFSTKLMLYFAYGSNMDRKQMVNRCPSTEFVCIAKLKDYRFGITRISHHRGCGVAGIIPAPQYRVWGVVYDIEKTDLSTLDYWEDFVEGRTANSYSRVNCIVYDKGDASKRLNAFTYFAHPYRNPPLANAEYKALILRGAKEWNLPMDYVLELEKIEIDGNEGGEQTITDG